MERFRLLAALLLLLSGTCPRPGSVDRALLCLLLPLLRFLLITFTLSVVYGAVTGCVAEHTLTSEDSDSEWSGTGKLCSLLGSLGVDEHVWAVECWTRVSSVEFRTALSGPVVCGDMCSEELVLLLLVLMVVIIGVVVVGWKAVLVTVVRAVGVW